MDVAELEALAESTALGLSRANQRLLDLEAQLTTHVGLDWGNQGLNYPHPNQSVSTMDFGGGVGRVYEGGIVMKNSSSPIWNLSGPVLYWADSFPTGSALGHNYLTDNYAIIGGSAQAGNSPNGFATLLMQAAHHTYQIESSILLETGTQYTDMVFTVESINAGQLSVYLLAGSPATDATGGFSTIDFTWDSGVILRFNNGGRTSDPAGGGGKMIYRSNTAKFRGHNGSAWDNFAMEGWVTTAIANNTDYAKILMLAGM